MLIVQICVGSSCHIKGSQQIVEMTQNAIAAHGLDADVALMGSFCIGKCNRDGVTVQVNDDVYTGVTPQNFKEFFNEHILAVAKAEN